MNEERSKFLEFFSLIALLLGPINLAQNWNKLPALVPTHYGLSGYPDAWGPKETLIILPVLSFLMRAVFSYGLKHPERSKVPWKVDDTNRDQTYALVKDFLIWERLAMAVLFTYLQVASVMVALKEIEGLGVWFLPTFLVAVFSPIVYFSISGKKFKDAKH